ncbi:MAG: asparagine synthase (glutamine-hydrolyzing), partial [Thermodesulfobacteriota bacterium]
MCGICGIVYPESNRLVESADIRKMCRVMIHRGPDDEGIWVGRNAGMGMRRLSIIDLETGNQPISNEDGSIWIVCNGEIYNHTELRETLIKRGHRFKTKSDVESILHSYEEYGDECSKYLNGMFAFIIWDEPKKRLLISRDRIGKKPLYYYFDKNRFICGSELKAILQLDAIPRRIDFEALDQYLTFEYIPGPLTIFKDIRKLMPGHFLVLENGEIRSHPYWNIREAHNTESLSELKQHIRDLLQDSVKIRLMSDVPLGAFLSGGIDSSIIVALMSQVMDRPVKTFSIGFKESTYNELEYTRIIARRFKTEHHEFIIEPDAVSLTEKLLGFLDEPLGDFSIFPTYLVSKMAREYVTVALSGDGGDELFAGYDTYIADRMASRYNRIPEWIRRNLIGKAIHAIPPSAKKKGLINRSKRFVEGLQLPERLRHVRWMVFLSEYEKDCLYSDGLKKEISGTDSYEYLYRYFDEADRYDPADKLNQQLYVDIKTYLVDDIMVKVDRMSMAESIEARAPYLDYRFVELVASIPGNLKLNGMKTKWILKEAARDLLPKEILARGKEGFSIPIKNWLQNELKPMMMDILSPDRIRSGGVFDSGYVERLKSEHLKGTHNHSHRLWALMVFEIWKEKYSA